MELIEKRDNNKRNIYINSDCKSSVRLRIRKPWEEEIVLYAIELFL